MKWENLVQYFARPYNNQDQEDLIQKRLNELGKLGWEPYAAFPDPDGGKFVYLKRQLT